MLKSSTWKRSPGGAGTASRRRWGHVTPSVHEPGQGDPHVLHPPLLQIVIQNGLPRRTRYTITDPHRLQVELARVIETGVAYDREEYELGITCVGSPLLNAAGLAWAAMSVTGPTTRFVPNGPPRPCGPPALGLTRVLGLAGVVGE